MSLTVEIALRMSIAPSDGLVLSLCERSRYSADPEEPAYREVRVWRMKGRSISTSELEDVLSSLSQEVTEHLLVGPGVQLTLHS